MGSDWMPAEEEKELRTRAAHEGSGMVGAIRVR